MEDNKDLKELVQELVKYEKKITSYWGSFMRGVLSGVGFFTGSAIITAAIIYVLTIIFRNSPMASQFEDVLNTIKSLKQ